MGKTKRGSKVEHGEKSLTLSGGAASPSSVTFREAFDTIPEVFLVHHLGDESATLTASSITTTGFSIQVAGSGLPNGATIFEFIAHEKT